MFKINKIKVVRILVNSTTSYFSYEDGDNIDAIVCITDNIANIRITSYGDIDIKIISQNPEKDFINLIESLKNYNPDNLRDFLFDKFEEYLS